MKLWPHQESAARDVALNLLAGHRSILVTTPTGGGKTLQQQIQVENAADRGERVAHYSNRRWLLTQTSQKMREHGIDHGIRMAGEEEDLDKAVQLCSVQTEASRVYKKRSWNLHWANLAVVDEAHLHGTGTSHRIITDHLSGGANVLGYTATPLGLSHLYDSLVVAGTNSELRGCNAHLPCHLFGCGELDTSKIKRLKSGEFSITAIRKNVWTQRIFGQIITHHKRLNPGLLPAIGFAPGVPESVWLAQQYCDAGIPAAHIDGSDCWVDGESYRSNQDARDSIVERWKKGEIKIVWNRFVMREGLDFPWLYHLILATPIGSLTSYIQTTGRVLRYWPEYSHVIVQDHGGNYWRHGSPNSNWDWEKLWKIDNRTITDIRISRMREGDEPQPIECPKCGGCRLSGPKCIYCGFQYEKQKRMVIQTDGSLKAMEIGQLRPRYRKYRTGDEKKWESYYYRGMRKNLTFNQIEALWAKENGWSWPHRTLPLMPQRDIDWFLPVPAVKKEDLL